MNRVARLAFREHHQPRTTLFWQELVWTDSTSIGPDHCYNRHNNGIWVEKGEAVPPLPKIRRLDHYCHCYSVTTRHGMTPPIFIIGESIKGANYRNIVLPHLIREVKRLMGDEPFLFYERR